MWHPLCLPIIPHREMLGYVTGLYRRKPALSSGIAQKETVILLPHYLRLRYKFLCYRLLSISRLAARHPLPSALQPLRSSQVNSFSYEFLCNEFTTRKEEMMALSPVALASLLTSQKPTKHRAAHFLISPLIF